MMLMLTDADVDAAAGRCVVRAYCVWMCASVCLFVLPVYHVVFASAGKAVEAMAKAKKAALGK
jgi:hypothetical protein